MKPTFHFQGFLGAMNKSPSFAINKFMRARLPLQAGKLDRSRAPPKFFRNGETEHLSPRPAMNLSLKSEL
jgi:hypothetical protein